MNRHLRLDHLQNRTVRFTGDWNDMASLSEQEEANLIFEDPADDLYEQINMHYQEMVDCNRHKKTYLSGIFVEPYEEYKMRKMKKRRLEKKKKRLKEREEIISKRYYQILCFDNWTTMARHYYARIMWHHANGIKL